MSEQGAQEREIVEAERDPDERDTAEESSLEQPPP
jgi:hypothetical protein